jgi:hypothetical protein
MDKFVIKLAGRQDYLTGDTLREKVVKNPSKARIFKKDTLPDAIEGLRYAYVLDRTKMVYRAQGGTVGLEVVPFWKAQELYMDLLDTRAMARKASGRKRQGMRQRLQSLYGDLNPGVR